MKRSLGMWQLMAAIYFCVSGGAFGLEPVVQLGPGMAILLILLTPLIWSAPAALMTAELASAIPEEGGYIVWVKRALGQPWSFLCGWWSWVYSWVDVAIYPTLFVAYLGRFLSLVGYTTAFDQNPWLKWSVGLILILPLTVLNLRGTKLAGESSVSFFAILLIPFVALVLFGMGRVLANPGATVHPFVAQGGPATGVFGIGLFAAMWNYLGWDSISTVSGEVRDPQRSYPRALAIGLAIVTASYLLPVMVGVAAAPDSGKWETGEWVQVAATVGGKWLAIGMAAAGIVSSAGQFCAMLLTCSRIPFVLADDRLLPHWLARLHPRFGTPWGAILVSAAVYAALSYQKFESLAVVDVILYSSALLLELIALAVLRAKAPETPRPYRIPGGWPVLGLVVLLPMALLVFACYSRIHEEGLRTVWLSLGALATGPVIWVLSRRLR